MTLPPRARARAITAGNGTEYALVVPLALRLAARIQERPLPAFFTDPTQLANGLRDFLQAVGPDGVVVTDPEALDGEITSRDPGALPAAPRISAALEATRRLRVTVGDTAVLVACLPGDGRAAELLGDSSAGASVLQVLAREFLGAGADILLLAEREAGGGAAQEPAMRTVANMARFHRALCYVSGPAVSFLDQPTVVPLDQPRPARGLVVTERELPADTSMTVVRDWVDRVRG